LRQIHLIMCCGLLCGVLAAQANLPERKVDVNTVTSERDPKVRIQLPKSAQYVGADRWILYDIADCELHAFVTADEQKNVRNLYWVQFEQYVPTRPELKHTYNSARHTQISGMDFYVDTWARAEAEASKSGSDLQHMKKLVRAKGYEMPRGMMYVRLVHLLDEQKRKELMIIYAEDLAPTRRTAAELQDGGKAHDQWSKIQDDLVKRAKQKLGIQQTTSP